MIALLAAVAMQGSGTLLEFPEPHAAYATIQIVVKLPELGTYDRATVRALVESLLDGTERFDRHELFDIGSANGKPPSCTTMPDHVRISLSVLPTDLTIGAAAAFDLITAPHLTEDSLNAAKSRLVGRRRGYWATALDSETLPISDVRLDDAQDMEHRLFVPGNVWVAVAGPFQAGAGRAAWEQSASDWETTRVRPLVLDRRPAKYATTTSTGVTTICLAGPSSHATDAGFAAQVLATYALGAGKASTLFQTLRQAHGWTYNPQAVVRPTPDGLRLCAIVPVGGDVPAALSGQIRAALAASVGQWTEEDRSHAISMATLDLSGESPWTPFYLSGAGPTTGSVDDRAFRAAYWDMKTGSAFDSKAFLGKLSSVSLDSLKAAATEFLKDSIAGVVKGN